MIAVIDYGVGNLASVANMLRKIGANSIITSDPEQIKTADKILLPGVGHFDHGMKMLNQSGIRSALEVAALELKKPILGICLGAQILGLGSEEGSEPGLGWIEMECCRLPQINGVKVPHMGWNRLNLKNSTSLFLNHEMESRYYFVHSYYMKCKNDINVTATCHHGIDFTCAVSSNNIMGTQFHPEKSLRYGVSLMRSFAQM